MNKENEPDFINNPNINHSKDEKIPYINSISNSKSNSSKTSSNKNKILLTQNSNNLSSKSSQNLQNSSFHILRKKLFRNTNIGQLNGILTFTDISIIHNKEGISLNITKKSNRVLSEGKKVIKIGKVLDMETPKKKYNDKKSVIMEKLKYKKKAILSADNIEGKNLMEYFDNMYVNTTTEVKNINRVRVSSAENIKNNTFKSNKNTTNTNKSWNKNNISHYQIKPANLINKYNKNFSTNKNEINNKSIKNDINNMSGYSSNRKNKAIITSLNNLFKQDIDFEHLINKYRPKKIINNNNAFLNKTQKSFAINCKCDKNKISTEKKKSYEKIKPMPKSDNNKRNFSISNIKIRESVKNLFQDFKYKQNEMENINKYKRKLSSKQIKNDNVPIISPNILREQKNRKDQLRYIYLTSTNNFRTVKIKSLKKKDTFDNNKKTNNPHFLKLKEKNEFEKTIQPNKRFNYKNSNLKK